MRPHSSLFNYLLATLLLLLVYTTAFTSSIIFPDVEPCTLNTGEQGRCLPLLDCPSVLQTFKQQPPVSCGFEGSTQIVCCPKESNPGSVTGEISDISAPSGYNNLECGRSFVTDGGFQPGFDSFLSRRKRALAAAPVDGRPVTAVPPVVGGQRSPRNAWPWMALIGRRIDGDIDWFCGGALLNDQWVLTALHCFHQFDADVVRLGEHDYSDYNDGANHQDYEVLERVLYPDYTHPQGYHDLALLKLERKVNLHRFILPVCLPWGRKSEENIVNKTATIVGWGNTLYGGFPSSVLMDAKVLVFPSSRCDRSYSNLPHYQSTWPHGIGEETLCAGDPEGGKDTCQGDSGGPMVTEGSDGRYVAVGVVSRGYGCGHQDYPGLYANLLHPPYLAWIKKVAFAS